MTKKKFAGGILLVWGLVGLGMNLMCWMLVPSATGEVNIQSLIGNSVFCFAFIGLGLMLFVEWKKKGTVGIK